MVDATESRARRISEAASRSKFARSNLMVFRSASRCAFSPARKPLSSSGTAKSTCARQENAFAKTPGGSSSEAVNAVVSDGSRSFHESL